MMLEAGKRYLDRSGALMGPIKHQPCVPPHHPYQFIDPDSRTTWMVNGRWYEKEEDERDLVAEYVEPMSDAEMQSRLAITAGIGGPNRPMQLIQLQDMRVVDHFALVALQSLLLMPGEMRPAQLAVASYEYAKAMMDERARLAAPVVEKPAAPASHPTDAERRALFDEGDACPF